jgi:hypothetical protein
LASNDEVDWLSLGKVFDPFVPPDPSTFLPNSFSAASENGLGLNIVMNKQSNKGGKVRKSHLACLCFSVA